MIRHKDIFAVLVLTVITCGIYFLFWLYDTSEQLRNHLDDQSVNPGLDLLLSMICFPYTIYWFYKTSKLINRAELYAGLPPNNDTILLVLLDFVGFGIISQLMIQNQLNAIADRYQMPR